jgi:hypothetical protein
MGYVFDPTQKLMCVVDFCACNDEEIWSHRPNALIEHCGHFDISFSGVINNKLYDYSNNPKLERKIQEGFSYPLAKYPNIERAFRKFQAAGCPCGYKLKPADGWRIVETRDTNDPWNEKLNDNFYYHLFHLNERKLYGMRHFTREGRMEFNRMPYNDELNYNENTGRHLWQFPEHALVFMRLEDRVYPITASEHCNAVRALRPPIVTWEEIRSGKQQQPEIKRIPLELPGWRINISGSFTHQHGFIFDRKEKKLFRFDRRYWCSITFKSAGAATEECYRNDPPQLFNEIGNGRPLEDYPRIQKAFDKFLKKMSE